MPFAALQKVRVTQLNNLIVTTYEAECDSTLTLSTTSTNVSGTAITVVTTTNGARWRAWGTFDARAFTGGAAVMQGRLEVDGVEEGREAIMNGASTGDRATIGQTWSGTIPSAGSITIRLRGVKSANVGTLRFEAVHTSLLVEVQEVV